MNGCRGSFTSLLVKMFTTEGIARLAARLYEDAGLAPISPGLTSCRRLGLLVTVTTRLILRNGSRSGRMVCTTSSSASATVVTWANRSHSLRMAASGGKWCWNRGGVDVTTKLYAGIDAPCRTC